MLLMRKTKTYQVYKFADDLFWIVSNGQVVKKVSTISEYKEYLNKKGE